MKSTNLLFPQIQPHFTLGFTEGYSVVAHRDIAPEKIAEFLFPPRLIIETPSKIRCREQ